jgi:hypothetical protein
MKNTDELLTNGYDFNMGKYMGDGWDLFKKGAGSYIGFTIVFFIIVMVLVFIPFVNILVSVFEYVLLAGIFIFSRNLLNDKAEFSNFFEGFNSFGQIFLFAIVLFLFTMPALVIFIIYLLPEGFMNSAMNGFADAEYMAEEIIANFQDKMGAIIFLYLVMILYMLYLYISYSFTIVLIVDRKMRFWDAMELSRKVIAKNFFSFFGMYIILGVLVTIGIIVTCGLGMLIAIPYMNLVIFSAYNNIIGPEEDMMEQKVEEFGGDAGGGESLTE